MIVEHRTVYLNNNWTKVRTVWARVAVGTWMVIHQEPV